METNTGTTQTTTAQGDPSKVDAVPDLGAAIKSLIQTVESLKTSTDKRFEGVSEKLRGKTASTEAPAANAGAAVTQGDLDASIRFGELRGSLPEAQRVQLEALRQDGLGFAQLVRIAEGFKSALPAPTSSANGGGTATANVAPPGIAANAGSQTTVKFPTTQSELLALKVRDRAAYDAVWAHPDFDARLLKRA